MNKVMKIAALTVGFSVLSLSSAFAGEWRQDANGWWYQNDDATYPVNSWQWIDGNHDGTAESYCFDGTGYLYTNTITPDGYKVNQDGAWTVDGVVQTQQVAAPQQTTDTASVYGTYERHDGVDAILEFGVYTDSGDEYVSINATYGWTSCEFTGTIRSTNGNSYTVVDEYGDVVDLTYNGVNQITITNSSVVGGLNFPGLEGNYNKTADFSSVG